MDYYIYRIIINNYNRVRINRIFNNNSNFISGKLNIVDNLSKIEELHTAIRNTSYNDTRAIKDIINELGELIFESVFNERLRRDILEKYDEAASGKYILHIVLDINENKVPDLAAIPWEFMCSSTDLADPRAKIGFSMDKYLIFSRSRRSNRFTQLVTKTPIKIAVVTANPEPEYNGPILDEPILILLHDIIKREADVDIKILPNASLGKIITLNNEYKPDILHFIGHSKFEEGISSIWLCEEDFPENGKWVKSDETDIIFKINRPYLVLLQSCESAAQYKMNAIDGLASRIVQNHIAFVVAMQFEIENMIAVKFIKDMYVAMLNHSIGESIQISRYNLFINHIATKYIYNFASPVIWMMASDIKILEKKILSDEEEFKNENIYYKMNIYERQIVTLLAIMNYSVDREWLIGILDYSVRNNIKENINHLINKSIIHADGIQKSFLSLNNNDLRNEALLKREYFDISFVNNQAVKYFMENSDYLAAIHHLMQLDNHEEIAKIILKFYPKISIFASDEEIRKIIELLRIDRFENMVLWGDIHLFSAKLAPKLSMALHDYKLLFNNPDERIRAESNYLYAKDNQYISIHEALRHYSIAISAIDGKSEYIDLMLAIYVDKAWVLIRDADLPGEKQIFIEKLDRFFEENENKINDKGRAVYFNMKSEILHLEGNDRGALELHNLALTHALQSDDLELRVITRHNYALAYRDLGSNETDNPALKSAYIERALDYFRPAYTEAEEINSVELQILCLENEGGCYFYMDDFDKSIEYYSRALHLSDRTENFKGQASNYANISEAYLAKGNNEMGQDFFEKAYNFINRGGFIDLRYFVNNLYENSPALTPPKMELNNEQKQAIYRLRSDPMPFSLIWYIDSFSVDESKAIADIVDLLRKNLLVSRESNVYEINENYQIPYI